MTTILQNFPFSEYLEQGLAKRGEVIKWYAMDAAAQAAWLEKHAHEVKAVATAGHIGCSSALLTALPSLQVIAINGVGFDKVELPLAWSRGIHVTTTPDMLTDDVADLGVGLIIALLRRLPAADHYVRSGQWLQAEMPLAVKVTGKRFGIFGLGKIGAALAQRLSAFGPVHYSSRTQKEVPWHYHASVRELAAAVDVLVIASAANADTRGIVNAEVLAALGPQGYLVNVARGAIVDEAALVAALEAGTLAGAALDVFVDEPRVPKALCENGKVVLSPHIASATAETRKGMADLVLANLDAALAGKVPPSALKQPR